MKKPATKRSIKDDGLTNCCNSLYMQLMIQDLRVRNGQEQHTREKIREELGMSQKDFSLCMKEISTSEEYRQSLAWLLGGTAHSMGLSTLSELEQIYHISTTDLHRFEDQIWANKKPRKLSKEVSKKLMVEKKEVNFTAADIPEQHQKMMNHQCKKLLGSEPGIFKKAKFEPGGDASAKIGASYRFSKETIDILKLSAAASNQTITSFIEDLLKNYASEYIRGYIQKTDDSAERFPVEGVPTASNAEYWYRPDEARNAIAMYNILEARHGKQDPPNMYFESVKTETTNPMTPHGKKYNPHLLARIKKPSYNDLFQQITDWLTRILTSMAGSQELVTHLLDLQSQMKKDKIEFDDDPDSHKKQLKNWYEQFVDIKERHAHIGDKPIAALPGVDEPIEEDEFDPHGGEPYK